MVEPRSYYERQENNTIDTVLAALVAIAAVGLVAFVLSTSGVLDKLMGKDATQEPVQQEQTGEEAEKQTTAYAEADRLRIDGGIAQAEQQAHGQDYAGALETLRALLSDYPDSSELQEKFNEYAIALSEQTKTQSADKSSEDSSSSSSKSDAKSKIVVANPGVNVRKDADVNAELIVGVDSSVQMIWDGQTKGPAGAEWYHVKLPDGREGWVSAPYVTVKGDASSSSSDESTSEDKKKDDAKANAKATYTVAQDTNLRSNSSYYSDVVTVVPTGSSLYFDGQSSEGLGSDGNSHTWYHLTTDSGASGWIREDFLTQK